MDLPICVLIEDDPGTLNGLIRDLEHRFREQYAFTGAPDAHTGLEVLERLHAEGRPVALIVAGLQLPDMAGIELLGRARSLHALAKRAALVDNWDSSPTSCWAGP